MRQKGTVIKRGNSWTAIYADPKVRDARGRKKPRWRNFPTEEAANAYLDTQLGSIRTGTHVPPTQETWDALLTRFETGYCDHMVRINQLSPSTARSYKSVINRHIRPYWGTVKVEGMSTTVCQDWAIALSTSVDEDGALSAKTQVNIINLFAKICAWCAMKCFITTNWMKDAEIARPVTPPKSLDEEAAMFLDQEEIDAIEEMWHDPAASTAAKVVAGLGMLAGLRRGEMCGFPWGAILWEDKRIRVIQNVSDGTLRTTLKSDASRAHIDIPDQLITILREHQAAEKAAGRTTKGGAFVLVNPNGKRAGGMYLPDELAEFWETEVRAKLKLAETSSLHRLRHTFASIMLTKLRIADVKYVSAQMRHANIQITVDTYAHIFPGTGSAYMAALDALFAPKQAPDGTDPKVLPFQARA